MTELLSVFGAGFITVFLAGIQSRAVNNGDYALAAINSFFISIGSAALWTKITDPSIGVEGWVAYGVAGSIGITAAMHTHKQFTNRKKSGRKSNEEK